MKRLLAYLHPAGVAAGALLTVLGLVLAESLLGPLIVRRMVPPEEALIAGIHHALLDEYVVPLDAADSLRLTHRAIAGMLAALDDDYSYFIEGGEELRKLREESTGRLIGIGAVIQGDGYVRYPRPGGPAEAAGLRPGDRFLEVDGQDVTSFGADQLVPLLKGKEGTKVTLTMERRDLSRYSAEVVRSGMPTGTVRRARMVDAAAGIATLHITSFAHSTPAELDDALASLEAQGARALVLDLRFNPGGVLPSAVDVAARFLRGGTVVTLKSRSGEIDTRRADPAAGRAAGMPVVILLNRYSASGSEVVAGALRDRGAAVIVGETSYGKGVFQQVRRYDAYDFAVKFAAGYFVTPAGRVIEGHLEPDRAGGIEPDLALPVGDTLSAEFLLSLRWEDPPEEYREEVYRLFPQVRDFPWPEDPTMDAALTVLRRILGEA